MKNTLGDLNNHLFAQLERLNEEDLDEHRLQMELERSKGICNIAQNIISNANTVLKAAELRNELDSEYSQYKVPKMLEG